MNLRVISNSKLDEGNDEGRPTLHVAHATGGIGEPDLLRKLLGSFINTLLPDGGQRGLPRWVRNGRPEMGEPSQRLSPAKLDICPGTLDESTPQTGSGLLLPEWLLERRKRAERARPVRPEPTQARVRRTTSTCIDPLD